MKFICIGKNYQKHIKEFDGVQPDSIVIFMKPETAWHKPEQDFHIPDFTENLHYEVEVLVKISKEGKCINKESAHEYYDEIGLGIDFTARDLQFDLKSKGLPWERGKSFDNSAIVGKFYPKENFKNLQDLSFELKKNDEIVQKDSTKSMIWKIDEIIAEASNYFTLEKGDIIFTGTPSGVGKVVSGDVLEGFLEGDSALLLKVK
ncbi:fumarylacetoacetate hydrolase family protein [Weeksellaceae bacterium TAE3-ERU29]|nr:fumarylacetoacetate hydrolase family protein [Weeksellaceae bacterium TAE3-ERU29]